jgi:hypothetical protein
LILAVILTLPLEDGFHEQVALIFGDEPVVERFLQLGITFPN